MMPNAFTFYLVHLPLSIHTFFWVVRIANLFPGTLCLEQTRTEDFCFRINYLFVDGLRLGSRRFVRVRHLNWGLSFLGVCVVLGGRFGDGEGGDIFRDLKEHGKFEMTNAMTIKINWTFKVFWSILKFGCISF